MSTVSPHKSNGSQPSGHNLGHSISSVSSNAENNNNNNAGRQSLGVFAKNTPRITFIGNFAVLFGGGTLAMLFPRGFVAQFFTKLPQDGLAFVLAQQCASQIGLCWMALGVFSLLLTEKGNDVWWALWHCAALHFVLLIVLIYIKSRADFGFQSADFWPWIIFHIVILLLSLLHICSFKTLKKTTTRQQSDKRYKYLQVAFIGVAVFIMCFSVATVPIPANDPEFSHTSDTDRSIVMVLFTTEMFLMTFLAIAVIIATLYPQQKFGFLFCVYFLGCGIANLTYLFGRPKFYELPIASIVLYVVVAVGMLLVTLVTPDKTRSPLYDRM
eukprot:c10337_g1_i1.p1 GENE.c10337_g1_i1~~c10337_g1_i1.p1  ORF type:complete len:327 (+),score=81.33 c10337_g1_i1:118-1098(+)